ncbi:MAG: alpha/beta hydrolase family protein [Solirubrobacterales bacterium]
MKQLLTSTTLMMTTLLLLPAAMTSAQGDSGAKPYHEEQVVYDNAGAGIRLAGTLTIPEGHGPHPAVLLITGSGPQDRDESIGPLKPFAVLADALARVGVAALRVDDRGVGQSTGNWILTDYKGYCDDARCGMEFLKGRPEIDARRIGLLGHSAGGVIAAMMAARSSEVAFIILLAAPCAPGEQVILLQNEGMLRRAGTPPEQIAKDLDGVRELCAVLKNTSEPNELRRKVQEMVARKNQSAEETRQEVDMLCTPWAKDHMTYNAQADLRRVTCPVLALWGAKDVLVTPNENAESLRACLTQKDDPATSIRILPDMNHLFQKCQTGDVSEFFQIAETINPEVLDLIAGWTGQRVGKR